MISLLVRGNYNELTDNHTFGIIHSVIMMIIMMMMMIIDQVMGRRQGGAVRGRLRAARSEDFLNRWKE